MTAVERAHCCGWDRTACQQRFSCGRCLTKYCGGLAPGDKYGSTCCQVGNLRGREQRELADAYPIKAIYTLHMNTIILQYSLRGMPDEETAVIMKRLAKNKMKRAISDMCMQGQHMKWR